MKLPPYGEINKLYRGTAMVPEDVYIEYRNTEAYRTVMAAAAACVDRAGLDPFGAIGYVREWGEASNHRQVEDFCKLWNRAIQTWQAEMRRKEAGYE